MWKLFIYFIYLLLFIYCYFVASPAVAVAADWVLLAPIQPPTTTVGFSGSDAICAWSRLSELAT